MEDGNDELKRKSQNKNLRKEGKRQHSEIFEIRQPDTNGQKPKKGKI